MLRLGLLSVLFLAPAPLPAQDWTAGDSLPLIRRAMLQRSARDADTALAAWRATAHGVVRSISIIDHGNDPLERLMKLDELTVEVYGEIPNRSKQVITRWRDTSFLPNRIQYHRDHLGIVANDFGETIRLGDGEEVRNLTHPLSPAGLALYLFRPGPTIAITGPRGTLHVTSVDVRPRDPRAAGTVGTLYLDTDRAALVRFRFTFTPAAYLDRTVRDITVVLESALRENARWLPWRQSIVIRREDPLLELPTSMVIRADWEIGDYVLGVTHPAGTFTGPSVAGPPRPPRGAPGEAPLAVNPGPLPPAEFDADAIQRAASAMLDGHLLDGLPSLRSSLAGFSDLVHVNRVGGVTASFGLRFPLDRRVTGRLRAGYAFSSHQLLGSVAVEGPLGAGTWRLAASRDLADIADAPVTSPLYGSIATAISGDDQGDWTLLDGGALTLSLPSGKTRVALELARQHSTSMATAFSPLAGTSRPNPSLAVGDASIARVGLSRLDRQGYGWSARLEGGTGDADWGRLSASGRRRLGRFEVAFRGGLGTDELPGYRSYALGGTGTLPGLGFRAIGGRAMVLGEAGYALPVTIPVPWFAFLPYARVVRRVPLPSTLTPFLAVGAAWGGVAAAPWRATRQAEPVAGVRIDLWAALLRLETGVSLRHGGWGIALDLHPDWWPLF